MKMIELLTCMTAQRVCDGLATIGQFFAVRANASCMVAGTADDGQKLEYSTQAYAM